MKLESTFNASSTVDSQARAGVCQQATRGALLLQMQNGAR